MTAICIIPAREGSKRIPHKNTKPFLGKPIIEYVFDIVKQSRLFDTILVTTDDKRAAGLAAKNDIAVLQRPSKLCDDHATTAEVLEHALWLYDGHTNACCVYPTSVFLTEDILREGMLHLPKPSFAAAPYPASIERAFTHDWQMVQPDKRESRSQDLRTHYYDAGQFYFVDTERFLREPKLLAGPNLHGVIMDGPVVDINTPDDWKMAETIYGAYYNDDTTGAVER